MAESYPMFHGKRGPATYKAAKGGVGRGNYGNIGGKPAHKARIAKVDRKVKRVSNKIMKFKAKNPGPAAYDVMGTI